jgi:hypothetical protein
MGDAAKQYAAALVRQHGFYSKEIRLVTHI